jgi:iron complex transport system permease protein
MTLAGVGSIYQLILNNPLAEPYILGVSSGAALGSILAGLTGLFILMPIFGFLGAMITMVLVLFISNYQKYKNQNQLLFSGIIAGMFISSIISLLLYLFQKETAMILHVLMGNTGHIFDNQEWKYFLVSFFVSIIILIYLYFLSNKLNIITSGDDVAKSMGVDVNKLRTQIFVLCSVLTGVCVSYAGIIGFVGLIVPQMIRMLIGSEQKLVFLCSVFGGAIFLLICDFIAINLTVLEIPVGIITSFIGCPIFVYILIFKKNNN